MCKIKGLTLAPYRLIVKAEHEAGLRGRPEALDYASDISDLLRALARKTAA
jgi:hypothetical protein